MSTKYIPCHLSLIYYHNFAVYFICRYTNFTTFKRSRYKMIDMYLYDDNEESQVQFVGFVGEHGRYDLMLVHTNRHYGKTLVLNMQTNKFGIIGTDDLKEEGYIAHILGVNAEEGDEITEYLNEVIH
ncbi:Cytosolic protein [Staphylococcus aureus]|nr:Cytosolic protein [Staphylococcus aureus]